MVWVYEYRGLGLLNKIKNLMQLFKTLCEKYDRSISMPTLTLDPLFQPVFDDEAVSNILSINYLEDSMLRLSCIAPTIQHVIIPFYEKEMRFKSLKPVEDRKWQGWAASGAVAQLRTRLQVMQLLK